VPTPLVGPIRDVLHSLKRICEIEAEFEPRNRGAQVPRLHDRCEPHHPVYPPDSRGPCARQRRAWFLEAARIDDLMPQALQSGEADLALGLIPSLETGFYQQNIIFGRISSASRVRRHPRIKKRA